MVVVMLMRNNSMASAAVRTSAGRTMYVLSPLRIGSDSAGSSAARGCPTVYTVSAIRVKTAGLDGQPLRGAPGSLDPFGG